MSVVLHCDQCDSSYISGSLSTYPTYGMEELAHILDNPHSVCECQQVVIPQRTTETVPPPRRISREEAAVCDAFRAYIQANSHDHYE